MATESPLIHDGAQNTLSTTADFRNSTVTGTTLSGPSGSGQFLAVIQSTTVDRTLLLATTASTGAQCYGICQNKPGKGDAVDVGVFGISKVVSGSTAIARGQDLMVSGTAAGVLIPYTTASGYYRVGRALESVTSIGAVFTAAIYGFGSGTNSV